MKKVTVILLLLILTFSAESVFANISIPFKGDYNQPNNQLQFALSLPDNGFVKVTSKRVNQHKHHIVLQVEKLKTPFFNLSTSIESKFDVFELGKIVRGTVKSQYTLFNNKPIRELSGSYEVRDNKLTFDSVTVGNLAINGRVDTQYPFDMSLKVALSGLGLKEFLSFWMREHTIVSGGFVSGVIRADGGIDNLFLTGELQSLEGFVTAFNFDNINLNIEGTYPHMVISNSTFTQENGLSYALSGPLNLSKINKIKNQILELSYSPLVSKTDQMMKWTIKRADEESGIRTELLYRVQEDPLEKGPVKESGMFGISNSMEF